MRYLGLSLKQLEHIVTEEIRRGKSADTLIRDLKKRGWPEAAAKRFVGNAQRMKALSHEEVATHERMQQHSSGVSLWPIALIGLSFILLGLVLR
jgi:hypothetical protein